MKLLAPYNATSKDGWTRRQAGHVLRRAGFAASDAELRQAEAEGLEKTVDRLLVGGDESARYAEIDPLGDSIAARGDIARLAAWWYSRLAQTQRPLAARMGLFWHNHFATSNVKVNSPPMMLRQLRTMEKYALGRFDELLLEISRDPAMIVWLDGDSNRRGKPNENYSRELFELFSLGPGNYTETDLRESARAFSGWHQKDGVYAFQPNLHDEAEKTVFGKSGNLNGEDVVALAIGHAACPKFLAYKLLREFVTDQPSAELVAEFADVLRGEQLTLAPAMRTLLLSRAFFDKANYRARIKSPVEFCVGIVRSWEMRAAGGDVHNAASQMGQRLFEPPTVKGWEGHRRWINSSNMLVRINAVTVAAAGANDGRGLDATHWVEHDNLADAKASVEFAISVMLDGVATDEFRSALIEKCPAAPAEALRTAVAAIGASPEYQLA